MVRASFIMGTMNSSSRIEKTIDSLINQSIEDWELIVVDDGSSDNTFEILENYAMRDSRIHCLQNKKNLKLAKTLNIAIKQVNSPYLVRIDDDDLCESDRLIKQLEFLDNNKEYAVCGSWANLIEDGEKWGIRQIIERPKKLDIFRGKNFIHPSVMMRTSVIKEIGGYNESHVYDGCEDYELWCRLYKNGYKGYNLQESLILYSEGKSAYKKRSKVRRIRTLRANWIQKKELMIGIEGYAFIFIKAMKLLVPNSIIYKFKKKSYGI